MEQHENLKNKAAKGLLWGGFFSISNQFLGLVFSIIIARILQPSDFGLVAMLSIFTSLATIFQESGFVFVLTNRTNVTREQYSSVFWFNIIISFSIYLLFFLLAPAIASFYNEPLLTDLARVVFLGFFISSFGIVQNAYLYKNLKVFEKGIAGLISLILSGIIGYLLAKNGFGYWGVAFHGLFNILFSTIIVWLYSPFRPMFKIDRGFLYSSIPDCFRFAFPNLFSIFSENFYSVILGKAFSPADVGLYNQATKLNNAGASSILGMLRNVSQPVLVKVRDNSGNVLSAFRKLFRLSAFLSFPVLLCLSMVSDELIVTVFTEKWQNTAPILKLLCWGGIMLNLSTLFSYFAMSQNFTKIYLWMGIFASVLKIFLLLLASIGSNVIWIAIGSVATDAICLMVYYFVVNHKVPYPIKYLIADLAPIMIASIVPYFIVSYATGNITNLPTLLIVRVLSYLLLFIVICRLFNFDILNDAKSYALKIFKRLK